MAPFNDGFYSCVDGMEIGLRLKTGIFIYIDHRALPQPADTIFLIAHDLNASKSCAAAQHLHKGWLHIVSEIGCNSFHIFLSFYFNFSRVVSAAPSPTALIKCPTTDENFRHSALAFISERVKLLFHLQTLIVLYVTPSRKGCKLLLRWKQIFGLLSLTRLMLAFLLQNTF